MNQPLRETVQNITERDADHNLDAYWLPFTSNRAFKKDPRIIVSAEGRYFTDSKGRQIFDGLSGLWTTGIGHGRKEICEAVSQQMKVLDYSPAFNFANPNAIELASRLADMAPKDLNHVFLTCTGSDSVDSALKIARAYWKKQGLSSKTKIIGRMKGYHGVNFGGTSVGGISTNRAVFGQGIDTDHLRHTLIPENAFSRGLPEKGAYLADDLLDMVELHDASNIAAVIVEPVAGSAGVIPPPQGYLKRLREICDQHNILLIFDEVITGFGRMGSLFGAEEFDVIPDMMTFAKQITNGTQPLGGVIAKQDIYQCFMDNTGAEHVVELPHGYTYSGHPVACAAALATLDILENEKLPQRVKAMSKTFEDALHSLRGLPHVLDIRNYGFAGALTIEATNGDAALRPYQIALRCWEKGLYLRNGGNTVQLGLPFTTTKEEIDRVINILGETLRELA